MGRGRQKAKNTKIARELKSFSPSVNYAALERELGHPERRPVRRQVGRPVRRRTRGRARLTRPGRLDRLRADPMARALLVARSYAVTRDRHDQEPCRRSHSSSIVCGRATTTPAGMAAATTPAITHSGSTHASGRVVQQPDAEREHRRDRVADALHEPAERDGCLGAAGPQAQQHEHEREQQRRDAEQRDPEPRRGLGREQQPGDGGEPRDDRDDVQRADDAEARDEHGHEQRQRKPHRREQRRAAPRPSPAVTPAVSTSSVGSHANDVYAMMRRHREGDRRAPTRAAAATCAANTPGRAASMSSVLAARARARAARSTARAPRRRRRPTCRARDASPRHPPPARRRAAARRSRPPSSW